MGSHHTRSARWRPIAAAFFLTASLMGIGVVSPVVADPVSPLTVTKTANPSPVASGEQLTYTILVTNVGGSKVSNVVLTDQVNGVGVIQNPPALPQLTITTTKGSCTQGGPNGNLVTCDVGNVNGGQSFTVTIRGQVTAANGTTLNNTASVTGTKSAQTFTTTGSVSVLVSGGTGGGSPLPDLTINKTGPTSVALSAPLDYTLTINNVGTANTANVKVIDTLPAGVTIDAGYLVNGVPTPIESTSLFSCIYGGSPVTVTCTGGAVNQGQNATIKIHAISPPTAPPDQITNTAVVDPDNTVAESNELNNTSASVNTSLQGPPPEPLLSIQKTDGNPDLTASWDTGAGPDPVNPGEWLTYVIQVVNKAASRADDVRISDTFQGLEAASLIVSQTVVNGTVGVGRGCVVNAAEAICSIRSLNAGGTLTMTVKGYVIAAAGSNLFNTATVHGNIKNVGVTNTATESTTVRPSIDLTITKDDGPDPACARTWPTTNPNQHLDTSPGSPPLVPAAGDIPAAGLLADPVCLGGLTYTFVIGNSGNGLATDVAVRDWFPAGLIFDSFESSTSFVCAQNGGVIDCTGGSVGIADTETLTFRFVAPPDVGTITNTVRVDPDNAIFEPDETNNDDTETTTISTGIDLVIWKGDDATPGDAPGPDDDTDEDPPGGTPALTEGFDPIATNGTQTYTIVVDNVGTQDVTGIKVRDVLPAGTRFLSFSADNGITCTHDGSTLGGVVTCIGGHLKGTAAEFYDPAGPTGPSFGADDVAIIKIKVFATSFVQPVMHNEVRVDPDNEIAEVNELNNFAEQNTYVTVGNDDKSAFNQLTVDKIQCDPAPSAVCTDPGVPGFVADGAAPDGYKVAQNGVVWYDLKVSNLGTDPVSAVVVKDFLPTGSRFIQAFDTDTGPQLSDAFFCVHDGSPTGGTITCLGGDLSGSVNKIPDGADFVPPDRHIRVQIFAPNTPGTYPNIVVVDPDNVVVEGNEFDNDDAVTTTVTIGGNNMFNELNLTKVQSDPTTECTGVKCVATSSVVEYTLVVKNDGSDPAFQVKVRDTLPAGFTFISADDSAAVSDANAFQCTNAANVVSCTSAMIAGGATRTIIVKAFSAAQPGDYVNQAVVDPDNAIPEGNETNNTAQATTRVRVGEGYIDLQVTKCDRPSPPDDDPGCAADSDPAVPSGEVTYVVTVTNAGSDAAFNVKVVDFMPAGTTFVSATDMEPGPGAFSCVQASGVITCTGGTLDGSDDFITGIDETREIEVVLGAPAAKGPITNQVVVDPDNAIAESNETNNSDSETTTIAPKINLTLDKRGPDTAHQNDTAEYVITVTNEAVWGGGETAYNVHVHDALPIGLIPLSVQVEPSNMICQILENPVNVLDCVGDLSAPGATPDSSSVTITVSVFVTADGGPLDNEACVDPTDAQHPSGLIIEQNEGDNCKTKTTTVLKLSPDLLVNKNVDTSTATPGQELTYTITVSNVGDATAAGPITLTDKLDTTKVDFVSATATNSFNCSFTSPNVECTNSGSLGVGDSTTITIKAKVKTGATGSVVNEASVPDGTAFDGGAPECAGSGCANEADQYTTSTNADNKDTVSTALGGTGIDLVMLSLTDDTDATNPGGIVTYTATATNTGTADATGVKVRVTLPATGLNHVISSASNGFLCGFVFPNIDCTGTLASGAVTIVTVVTQVTATAPPDTSVTVTSAVDPSPGTIVEDDETNNTASQTTTVSASCATGCIDLVASPVVATPATVGGGGYVEFIVGVGNAGDTNSGNFDIELKLTPTGDFDFEPGGFDDSQPSDDYSATADFDCQAGLGGDTITCNGDLDGGEGVLIILKVHIKGTPTNPGLTVSVTADSGGAVSEEYENNNTASGSVTLS